MTVVFDFDDAFKALTGHPRFPWQRRLFDKWLSIGKPPSAVDIPTGLGKTSVMAIWLLALCLPVSAAETMQRFDTNGDGNVDSMWKTSGQ